MLEFGKLAITDPSLPCSLALFLDLEIKRELNKSFRDADMDTVWKLHDKLSHRDAWTYDQMIAVAAKGGFVKKAFSLFQKMKKVPLEPSLGTYHWLLHACVNGKEKDGNYLSRAFYVVEMMEASKISLNLHSYNLLLQICANANDIEMASEVLRKMSSSGIRADVSSLSSLLNCTAGDRIEPILQVWNELCAKFTPDERAWNTYIKVLTTSKFYNEAIAAFKEYTSTPAPPEMDPTAPAVLPVPSPYTLTLFFDACSESKNFAEARPVLLRILDPEQWRSKITFDEILFQSMLRIAARLKSNVVFAIENFILESKFPIQKATRELFIMAYGRTNDMKGALRHFEAARTAGELNLRCFTGLLVGCRSTSDPDRAMLSFDVMRRVKIHPDPVYTSMLTEIVQRSGRPDLIKRLEEALPNNSKSKSAVANSKAESKSTSKDSVSEYDEEHSHDEIAARALHDRQKRNSSSDHHASPRSDRDYPQSRRSDDTSYPRSSHSQSRHPQGNFERRPNIIYGNVGNADQVFVQEKKLDSTTTIRRIPSTTPTVILPSEAPSASRSSFFSVERMYKERNQDNGNEDSL